MRRLEPHGAEIARLYAEGASTIKIARRYGVTPRTVWLELRRMGVTTRRRRWARMRRLEPHGAEIARLYRDGQSLRVIAERFGVSWTTVQWELRHLGVVMRPPGAPRGQRSAHALRHMPRAVRLHYWKLRYRCGLDRETALAEALALAGQKKGGRHNGAAA